MKMIADLISEAALLIAGKWRCQTLAWEVQAVRQEDYSQCWESGHQGWNLHIQEFRRPRRCWLAPCPLTQPAHASHPRTPAPSATQITKEYQTFEEITNMSKMNEHKQMTPEELERNQILALGFCIRFETKFSPWNKNMLLLQKNHDQSTIKITSVTVTNVNRNFGDKVKEISQTADQVVNKT